MGKIPKKWLMTAAAVLLAPGLVFAATTTLHVTANFVSNITLTPTDMQFGNISFNGTPGASDTVVLTTNNAISYNGVFSTGGAGTVASGDILIGGTFGSTMDISCAVSGTLAQSAGSGRIDVNGVKVANESAASGGGVLCGGIGTVVLSFPLTSGTDDQLKVGGKLDGGTQASFGAGAYSTQNAGGTPIQVDVVYQ
jgi:hypothetical protein